MYIGITDEKYDYGLVRVSTIVQLYFTYRAVSFISIVKTGVNIDLAHVTSKRYHVDVSSTPRHQWKSDA